MLVEVLVEVLKRMVGGVQGEFDFFGSNLALKSW
jgi:hypothetical protein